MVIVKPELTSENLSELRNKVLARLGYNDKIIPDHKIKSVLEEFLDKAPASVKPRGMYAIIPVTSVTKHEITLEHGAVKSPMFAGLVGRSSDDVCIAFLIATAGGEWRQEPGPEEPLHLQMLFDAIGSELVELIADLVEQEVKRDAEQRGLKTSMRFSPGYCDWDLEGQKLIFQVLDAERIGVSLSTHFVMSPQKSVSSISVLAKNLPAAAPCAFCAKDCQYRRMQLHKGV